MEYLLKVSFSTMISIYYVLIIIAIYYTIRGLARDIFFNISEGIKMKVFYMLKIFILLFLFFLPIFALWLLQLLQ